MFFTANDSIKLNMSRDDAIKLFEKTFYDMHKAGYTLSTRIIHTDYNGKKFTGFIDNSGKYIARYIGNVENDRYYRFNRYVQHHAKNSFYIHNRRCGCNELRSFRNK